MIAISQRIVSRRTILFAFCVGGLTHASIIGIHGRQTVTVDVAAIDRVRILNAAEQYLHEAPLTITAFPSSRSAGGVHEYFSEGDYWWPDPTNAEVQRNVPIRRPILWIK
ncbi:MAG: hypothetical protein HW389_1417 [Bacteroidetes bacterium]|nr:hypothetical protein [Bacteroidota bacterium]